MSVETSILRDNIARVRESIAQAAIQAGRDPHTVKLVAVSKTHSAARVAEAAQAGLRLFGENRVQEAASKIPPVAQLTALPLEWHLIGTLQRNKVKSALSLFALLQSVDSLRLAEEISRRAGASPEPVLLEVYFGEDPTRPGFRPGQLAQEIVQLAELPGLQLRGLMTVAPLGLDERGNRTIFASLRELRDTLAGLSPMLSLPELSMGMTDDYPLAIAEGATIVRIGRAIFGERPSR